jgi:hypothetical protein
MKRENLALGVSAIALIICILTFWWSLADRRVTFEQSLEELRLLVVQGQILTWEIELELQHALRYERDTARLKELSDAIHGMEENDRTFAEVLHQIDDMHSPVIPLADTRVQLERLVGHVREKNENAQAALNNLRSSSRPDRKTAR